MKNPRPDGEDFFIYSIALSKTFHIVILRRSVAQPKNLSML
jgi:hypothetical protein